MPEYVFISDDGHLGAVGPFETEEQAHAWLHEDGWPGSIGGTVMTLTAPDGFRPTEETTT